MDFCIPMVQKPMAQTQKKKKRKAFQVALTSMKTCCLLIYSVRVSKFPATPLDRGCSEQNCDPELVTHDCDSCRVTILALELFLFIYLFMFGTIELFFSILSSDIELE